MVRKERIENLNKEYNDVFSGKVIYFMEREHRVNDNWALLYAKELADKTKSKLEVVVLISNETMTWQERQVLFAIQGLKEVSLNLHKYNIPLTPFVKSEALIDYLYQEGTCVVTDFNPLRRKQLLNDKIVRRLDVPYFEVDAHNIVPCKEIHQGKPEIAARTIRPKINKALDSYLTDFPRMSKHEYNDPICSNLWLDELSKSLDYKRDARCLSLTAGELAAYRELLSFLTERINNYSALRNNPVNEWQSKLSPYFHFGHIAPQRVALMVNKLVPYDDNVADFLEEMIIRRELTDNYCYQNDLADSTKGFASWAVDTLSTHLIDQREYIYSYDEFRDACTHDPIWNAAQKELLCTGTIHGYLRMYWAKKILEWTLNDKDAFKIALQLNDTYAIDGNDPNGIVGVAWSIGGIHDHGWKERPVFGKIRYMNDKGCKRKFDVEAYIKRVEQLCAK